VIGKELETLPLNSVKCALRSENKVQGSVRYPLRPRAPGFFKIKPHELDWVAPIQVKLSVTVHKLVSLPATVQDCFVLDVSSEVCKSFKIVLRSFLSQLK
jgi:hypothetical protein